MSARGGVLDRPQTAPWTLPPAVLSHQHQHKREAMRRSLRIAAVLSSARALIAPVSRRSALRLMASASGAPEDETRGGTASLADQVARARTRVGTRLRARVERDWSVLRREDFLQRGAAARDCRATSERALRSFLRRGAARGRKRARAPTTREGPHTHAKKHTVRPSAKGRQPALPRHRERV